jgi:hypothetical protein
MTIEKAGSEEISAVVFLGPLIAKIRSTRQRVTGMSKFITQNTGDVFDILLHYGCHNFGYKMSSVFITLR